MTVAFARKDPEKTLLWITVKTGSLTAQSFRLKIDADLLQQALAPSADFMVTEVLSQGTQAITGKDLMARGFDVHLDAGGSTVFVVEKNPQKH